MRRTVMLLLAAVLVASAVPAAAQEDAESFTSWEPLTRIVDGLVTGETAEGLIFENAPDSPITAQFQVFFNNTSQTAFGFEDVEFVPTGLPESGLEVVDLQQFFDGTLGWTSLIPPLNPGGRAQEGLDLSSFLEGWEAFDDGGPLTGPPLVLEQIQSVVGLKLAEPFDTSCSSTRYVGRAWAGSSITSGDDPLFTEAGLEESFFTDAFGELAGDTSRLVYLQCAEGQQPFVWSYRNTADRGARPFGPTGAIALVKDDVVLFFMPTRVLDSDLRQVFFADLGDGRPVEVSRLETEPLVLLPNPYGDDWTRFHISWDLPDEEANAGGATIQNLLYTGQESEVVQTGTGCAVAAHLFMLGLSGGWVRDLSLPVNATLDAVLTLIEMTHVMLMGEIQRTMFDFGTGRVTATLTDSSGAECTNEGGFTTSGAELPGFTDATGSSGGGEGADSGDAGGSTGSGTDDDGTGETDEGAAGGVPWVPIGIVAILLAVAAGTIARRRGTRDCEPEKQAYAAADANYDQAKRASDHYQAEYEHHRGEYNRYQNQLDQRTSRPNRELGYPEGSEGQARYEDDLAHWESQEADAEVAEHNLEGARQAMEAAERERDEADAALQTARDQLEAARLALDACMGTSTPPPPPVTPGGTASPPSPTETGGCTDGETRDKTVSRADFVIPGGKVTIEVPTGAWKDATGGEVSPDQLAALDRDDLLELFADLPNRNEAPSNSYSIPTITVTVKCVQRYVCRNGQWVESGEIRRVEEITDRGTIYKPIKSKDPELSTRLVEEAQEEMAKLKENEQEMLDYRCD